MEFRFRAGDRGPRRASSSGSGDSSSTRFPYPCDGHFGAQGMRAGPLPPFDWEAARRECFIREEVERRLIEAEVRRELEANRDLAFAGGFGPDRFMPPPPMPMHLPPPMPFGEFGAWQQAPDQFGPRGQAEFGQRMLLPGEERRWPPLPPKPKHKLELREIHPCESSKVLSSEKKVLRPKRKSDSFSAPTEPKVGSKQKTTEPRKVQGLAKDWSCALCQVSATCEAGLNEHLEGKKHKIKLAQCGAIKVVTDDKSSLPATTGNKNDTDSSDAPKKICILVDGAMHEVVQKSNYLWCERCKIRCHSNVTMAGHLRGKKHSELNKVWTSIKAARMNTKNKEGLASNHESKVNENGSTESPVIIKDDVDMAIEVDKNDPIENPEEIKKEGMFMATQVHENIPVETPVEMKKEGADMSNHNDVTQPLPKE